MKFAVRCYLRLSITLKFPYLCHTFEPIIKKTLEYAYFSSKLKYVSYVQNNHEHFRSVESTQHAKVKTYSWSENQISTEVEGQI